MLGRSARLVGVDFGAGVIRAAETSPNAKGRSVLHRYGEIQVDPGAINEGVVVDQEAVVRALRELWSRTKFTTKRVVLGMGSQQVLTRELTVPRLPLAQIRESLPFRVQDMLPLPVHEAVLDFFPTAEILTEDGPQLRGLLVAATRSSVLANARAAAAAGLETVDIDLIPFAVSRVQLGLGASETEVLLHVGAATTSILVAERGVPQFVRVVPTGGNDVTTALAERLGVPATKAEELKRRIGMTYRPADEEAATVARHTADAVGEQIRAVRSTIAFYKNQRDGVEITRVVLSGGGAGLRGFARALSEAVELPVTTGYAPGRFSVGSGLDESTFLAYGPSPAVAVGLTMRSAA